MEGLRRMYSAGFIDTTRWRRWQVSSLMQPCWGLGLLTVAHCPCTIRGLGFSHSALQWLELCPPPTVPFLRGSLSARRPRSEPLSAFLWRKQSPWPCFISGFPALSGFLHLHFLHVQESPVKHNGLNWVAGTLSPTTWRVVQGSQTVWTQHCLSLCLLRKDTKDSMQSEMDLVWKQV